MIVNGGRDISKDLKSSLSHRILEMDESGDSDEETKATNNKKLITTRLLICSNSISHQCCSRDSVTAKQAPRRFLKGIFQQPVLRFT